MITHEELMRYLDGELPPERVRAVEEAMERSTELRPMGWVLFVAGAAVWLAYVVYAYLTSAEALWMKLATSAVVIGLAMLLLSALLDRLLDLRTDPYKEIHR